MALGYTVTIDASSTYDVDWGDGTIFEGLADQGGPYPSGSIRHNYQHADPDNVVAVTQNWTATWTATIGGQTATGTISEPLYTEAAFPLEIGENPGGAQLVSRTLGLPARRPPG